jgi:hypothetical protein
MPRHENAGQNHDKKMANRSFEDEEVGYLRTTVTDQNLVREEIESTSDSGTILFRTHYLLVSCLKQTPWPESVSEIYRPSDRDEASAHFCG